MDFEPGQRRSKMNLFASVAMITTGYPHRFIDVHQKLVAVVIYIVFPRSVQDVPHLTGGHITVLTVRARRPQSNTIM